MILAKFLEFIEFYQFSGHQDYLFPFAPIESKSPSLCAKQFRSKSPSNNLDVIYLNPLQQTFPFGVFWHRNVRREMEYKGANLGGVGLTFRISGRANYRNICSRVQKLRLTWTGKTAISLVMSFTVPEWVALVTGPRSLPLRSFRSFGS